nr:serine hydrolase [uncultured Blautia sp.]
MNTETKGKTIGKILLIFFLILVFTGIGILIQVFARQSTELAKQKKEENGIQEQISAKNDDIAELEKEKEQLNSKLQEQKAAEEEQQKDPEGLPGLLDRITPILEGQEGTWSVYVENLDNGQSEKYNDSPMKGAGLLKLYVMGAAYTQNQNGTVQVDPNLIHTMIGANDNEVANQILDQIGGTKYVNQYMKENGYEETNMEDQFGEKSITSVSDCGKFLENVYKNSEEKAGDAASENISDKMMADIRNQKTSGKIWEGLGQEHGFANKTGNLDGVENEAAIIFNENGPAYIICIMSQDVDKNAAPDVIKMLSSEVYSYFSDSEAESENPEETADDAEDSTDESTDATEESEDGTDENTEDSMDETTDNTFQSE